MFAAISAGMQVKPLPTVPDSNITIPDRPAGWDCIFKSIPAGFPWVPRHSHTDVPLWLRGVEGLISQQRRLTLIAWLKQLTAACKCSVKWGKWSCVSDSWAAANDLADDVKALASLALLLKVCSHLQQHSNVLTLKHYTQLWHSRSQRLQVTVLVAVLICLWRLIQSTTEFCWKVWKLRSKSEEYRRPGSGCISRTVSSRSIWLVSNSRLLSTSTLTYLRVQYSHVCWLLQYRHRPQGTVSQ